MCLLLRYAALEQHLGQLACERETPAEAHEVRQERTRELRAETVGTAREVCMCAHARGRTGRVGVPPSPAIAARSTESTGRLRGSSVAVYQSTESTDLPKMCW